jgi:hypothetical protein
MTLGVPNLPEKITRGLRQIAGVADAVIVPRLVGMIAY